MSLLPYQGSANVLGAASTTLAIIGFGDRAVSAASANVPVNFIGFAATTTTNWKAIVVSGGLATTTIDTGVATSTTATTSKRFRVEVSSSTVNFLIDGNVVAVISPASQVSVPLAPMVAVSKTVAEGLAVSEADIASLRVWIDDPISPIASASAASVPQGLTIIETDPAEQLKKKLNRNLDFERGTGSGVWYIASTSVPQVNMLVGFSSGISSAVVEPASRYTRPIGVMSWNSSFSGLSTGDIPVVTSGRIKALVSLSGGAINVGDEISVSTTTLGVGTRAVRAGYIIGRAVEAFDPANNLGVCQSGSTSAYATTTCIGLLTIALAPGWSEGNSSLFQDLAQTITDVPEALLDFTNSAFASGAQITKFVVGKLVAQTAVIKDLFAQVLTILPNGKLNVPAGSNQIAGSDTLPVGATTYFVANTNVTQGAKIFITPRASLSMPIAVTAVTPGQGFTVSLAGQAPTDIPFDWFMVGTYDAGSGTGAPQTAAVVQSTNGSGGGTPPPASAQPPLIDTSSSTPPIGSGTTTPLIDNAASTTPATTP